MGNRNLEKNKFKHLDFILADILIVELSYFLATFWYRIAYGMNNFPALIFRHEVVILLLCIFVSLLFENPYKGIMRRDKWQEMIKTLQHILFMGVLDILTLFFIHEAIFMSRMTFLATWVIYFVLQLTFRYAYKRILRRRIRMNNENNASYIIVCRRNEVEETVKNLSYDYFVKYLFNGIFLVDYDETLDKNRKVLDLPVLGGLEEMHDYCTHNWVDSAVLNLPYETDLANELEKHFDVMGITTHHVLVRIAHGDEKPNPYVSSYGNYLVATYETREVPMYQHFLKRVLDICGGLVGTIITGIVFLIVGPQIYMKSPGPIIFKQERVGKNGKTFTMYKFRSMYMDAEERKAELMKQNKMNGLMFKMDDDPRIIGSEKKDKNGNPKGIGNFIRKTSLDEFPQFINVLKGDMSLVGTRPPTIDEWKQYSEHHRKRLAIKPGITGMWQISGRSDITDFEEIVHLDNQYIDNWTVGMDIRILFITVAQVLRHKGAE